MPAIYFYKDGICAAAAADLQHPMKEFRVERRDRHSVLLENWQNRSSDS